MFYAILFAVIIFFVFRYLRKEFREVVEHAKKGYAIPVKPIELVYDIYSGVISYSWKDGMESFLESAGYSKKDSKDDLSKGFYYIGGERRESDNFYTERSYTLRVICKNLADYLEICEKALNLEREHRESKETLARRESHNDRLRSTGYF